VGEIYGLFDEPNGFSLLWGLEKIQPRLPKGHLPIAGWLDYYSLSLEGDAGCIYLWDEMAAPCKEFDERGKKIFNAAHGVLVAGSFNEFLTRIALYQDREETNEPQADSTPVDDPGTASKKQPEQKSNDFIRKQLVGRDKSRLSQRRQFEILRLTYEGGDELTAAIAQGEKAYAKHRRQIYREITDFLKTTTNKDELHFFADNWHWEASGKPVLQLIKNPHVDAGTLLQIFWYGCPEDYYQFDRHESEIDDDAERVVFQALRQIERRIVKGEYKTAAIPFDPSKWISMWERRSEFARPIPDVMYQPILGGKPRKG
jgi:hypothetical protein